MNYRRLWLLIFPAVIYLLCIRLSTPTTTEPAGWTDNSDSKLLTYSDYKPLLQKYKANIDLIEKRRTDQITSGYKQTITYFQKRDRDITKHEPRLLDQLRHEALGNPKHVLDFEGEVLENTIKVPTSDAAGRIMHTLYKEHLLNESCGLPMSDFASIFSPEWISLVQDIANTSPISSSQWHEAVIILYKAGVQRDKYRPSLEVYAKTGGASALTALLFEADKNTGIYHPLRTPENAVLLKNLLKDKQKPSIKAVCAYYAASTGGIKLAEGLCDNLFAMHYISSGSVKLTQNSDLFHARFDLYKTLFYKIRTESAFKLVFQRAVYSDLIEIGAGSKLPKDLGAFNNYLAKWELEEAKGLINQLSTFDPKAKEEYQKRSDGAITVPQF